MLCLCVSVTSVCVSGSHLLVSNSKAFLGSFRNVHLRVVSCVILFLTLSGVVVLVFFVSL